MDRQAHGSLPPVRVEICRVRSGQTLHVRSLSETYSGMLTHYLDPSQYHDLAGKCAYCHTKSRIQWKGYFAAEVWDEPRQLWFPTVFELTESSELDVRGLFARAQVWQFSRLPDSKKEKRIKRYPTIGALQETLDATKLRPAFDVLPILRTVYHAAELELGVDNPTPERVFLTPSTDQPPVNARKKSKPEKMSAEDHAALRERMRETGWVPPEERKAAGNGKH